MLALLSSPIRRWLLTVLLVPVVAFALRKLAQFLQRRNEGEPTRSSRGLMKLSSGLRRLTGKEPEDAGDTPTDGDRKPSSG
ncbi:hypothetical protein [Mycobacterium sp. IDR2000157661]|uniref:hypothetical protein n=1 Tax=Mycobacterium sp. IDR2000157661 TaxID=2867005 RepID=UPI001EEDD0AE|nr:hypothetical protein [Mycobacterium sp. IDR2000157661]ULE34687.1 hypothetical protein K3G64_08885 [Mycobacterium sp. IDR2000157661]